MYTSMPMSVVHVHLQRRIATRPERNSDCGCAARAAALRHRKARARRLCRFCQTSRAAANAPSACRPLWRRTRVSGQAEALRRLGWPELPMSRPYTRATHGPVPARSAHPPRRHKATTKTGKNNVAGGMERRFARRPLPTMRATVGAGRAILIEAYVGR